MDPLILLSSGMLEQNDGDYRLTTKSTYAQSVIRAGGVPVAAPVCEGIAHYASRFDALLLTGGVDIDPLRWNEENTSEKSVLDPMRDQYELELTDAFVRLRRPVFGICRGLQLLNVYFGGSLIQDLPSEKKLNHAGVTHAVKCERSSMLFSLLGENITTNSFHHQSIGKLGGGLRATARTADGMIEAAAHENLPVWGVQWHPERQNSIDTALPDMSALFTYFIRQADMR